MKTEIINAGQPEAVAHAAALIEAGRLVAFPTDTVYGLAANVRDQQAIEELFRVKGREASKAIAVLLAEPQALSAVTPGLNKMAQQLSDQFWPGPLTVIVAKRPDLPENLSPYPTLGVRMPDHPTALALLKRTGPLAVTSANLSGSESTRSAEEVLAQLEGRIPLILDGGRTPGGSPSTVVDCTGSEPVILRVGPVTAEQIRAALLR